jgi:hypothetical protein
MRLGRVRETCATIERIRINTNKQITEISKTDSLWSPCTVLVLKAHGNTCVIHTKNIAMFLLPIQFHRAIIR